MTASQPSLEKLPIFRTRRDVWAALLPRRSRTAFPHRSLRRDRPCGGPRRSSPSRRGDRSRLPRRLRRHVPMVARSGSFELAALIALFVLLTNLVREDYNIETLLSRRPHLRRAATVWTGAWAIVLLIGFATKTTHEYSRLVSLGFFLDRPAGGAARPRGDARAWSAARRRPDLRHPPTGSISSATRRTSRASTPTTTRSPSGLGSSGRATCAPSTRWPTQPPAAPRCRRISISRSPWCASCARTTSSSWCRGRRPRTSSAASTRSCGCRPPCTCAPAR